MRRTIVEPADVSASALAELKNWLGISRPSEDELLIGLLQASLAMCEAFTGQAPLSQLVEERIPVRAGQTNLTSRPVISLETIEIVAQDGSRTDIDADAVAFELLSIGNACVRLNTDVEGQAVAITVRVGIADTWDDVPAAIKQGIIRLAAFYYRDRDRTGGAKSDAAPPASVTALWRPWRAMRLQ